MASGPSVDVCVAAFSLEIAHFLDDKGLIRLRHASRLLWIVLQPHVGGPDNLARVRRVVSLVEQHEALARDLRLVIQPAHASGSTKSKRSKGVRLRGEQLVPLMRDLALVGLGVRASCLVDTCQLDVATAGAITTAFHRQEQWRNYGLHNVVAIAVAGNVFFVNVPEFFRLKCLDIATNFQHLILIDASGELTAPQELSRDVSHRRARLIDTLRHLVHAVIDSVFSKQHPNATVEVDARDVCSTAIAGLILCYPVVYHIGATQTQDDDPFWTTSTNCLGTCPLHLVQTSLSIESMPHDTQKSTRLVLQEFSLPQHLQNADQVDGTTAVVARIVDQCQRALEGVVGGTGLISINVEVSARTLPQVAL